MRVMFSGVLALALWTLGGCAPAPAPTTEPAIWRISDADSEIWLYGTVHVLPENIRWRGPRVEAAFARAEEFVTETDTGEEAAAAFPELAMRYGSLPEGESLSARLSEADRQKLARIAQDLGLAPTAIDRLRPWLAALQLTYAYAQREGHGADAGVETVLAADARRAGKLMSFLETPEEQVRVLATLSPDDEAHFLSVTLRQIEEDDETLDTLDAAWARGDVRTLTALLDAQWREAGPAVHEAIILGRNRAWAEAIAQKLDGSGRVFIAVGAAHLVGDGSVVDLLRERGIAVEGP